MEEKTIFLRILAPDKKLNELRVSSLVLPLERGSVGILPQHAPTLAILSAGIIKYKAVGNASRSLEQSFYIEGGFAQVDSHSVDIMLDTPAFIPYPLDDIQKERAQLDYDAAKSLSPRGAVEIEQRLRKMDAARIRLR